MLSSARPPSGSLTHLCRTPGPPLVDPHLPRPGWARGLPTNLPTCQLDSRMRRRLARGGGPALLLYSLAHSPCHPRPIVAGAQRCPVLGGARGKDPGDFRGWEARCAPANGERGTAGTRSSSALVEVWSSLGRAFGRALQDQQGWGAGPCFLRPSIKIDLPKPCTYRNIRSIPPRDHPLPITSPGQTACSSLQGELGSPPSQLYYTVYANLRSAPAAGGTPRALLLRAERQEPRMLQGSAPAAFPARSQRYVPRCPPCHLGVHRGPVRPFLARFLCSLMRATNKQASKQATRPAGLPPGSPPPGLSFFLSRLRNHARMDRRKGEAHV